MAPKKGKNEETFCFDELDVLSGGLEASPGALRYFMDVLEDRFLGSGVNFSSS
jgi:hypothetical protein